MRAWRGTLLRWLATKAVAVGHSAWHAHYVRLHRQYLQCSTVNGIQATLPSLPPSHSAVIPQDCPTGANDAATRRRAEQLLCVLAIIDGCLGGGARLQAQAQAAQAQADAGAGAAASSALVSASSATQLRHLDALLAADLAADLQALIFRAPQVQVRLRLELGAWAHCPHVRCVCGGQGGAQAAGRPAVQPVYRAPYPSSSGELRCCSPAAFHCIGI